ncbi:hypothetical protein ES703_25483 [subsurface metagenome]
MKLRYISNRWQIIKSFYTGIGKTGVIFPSTFLVALGFGTVALGMIFYVQDVFAATPSQIGFLFAIWSLSYIIGCIFIRPLFNKILPRYLLIVSAFAMGVFIFFVLFTKNFYITYFYYGLWGLSMSLFWPPIMGWLSQGTEGAQLGKLMSNYNLSWSVGTIISPILAGVLSSIASPVPIYFGSFLFILTCTLITGASLALPKIKQDNWVDSVKNRNALEKDNSTHLRFPAWVGLFTSYAVIGVIFNIFPVFARNELGLGKETIGLLLQVRAIFATLGFIAMGRSDFWHFEPLLMIAGQIFLAAIMFLMSFVSLPFFLGAFIALLGACMAISHTNSLFHGVSGSINRSGRMAVHEILLSAGLIAGSAIGGVIYQNFSMSAVYLFCSFLVTFGLLIQCGLSIWIISNEIR